MIVVERVISCFLLSSVLWFPWPDWIFVLLHSVILWVSIPFGTCSSKEPDRRESFSLGPRNKYKSGRCSLLTTPLGQRRRIRGQVHPSAKYTHTLILALPSLSHFLSLLFSSLLSFRVSWHYIPCFFNHTTSSKIQGLWFLCFFKKLYLWEKANLDCFSNLPFFSWVPASFRKVLVSDLAYAPKGAFSKSMYLILPPWDSETFPQGQAGPW